MAYHAIVRDSDQAIVGIIGDPSATGVDVGAGFALHTISQSQDWVVAGSRGLIARDGRYRFKIESGGVVEVPLGGDVFLLFYEDATNYVTGTKVMSWAKSDEKGHIHGGGRPGRTAHIATAAQYASAAARMKFRGEEVARRWKLIAGELIEQVDTRPIVRFTPPIVEVPVGATPPIVTVEIVDENGDVRTNVNTTSTIRTANGKRVPVTITNGVGSLTVPTAKERRDKAQATPDYLTVEDLDVTVFDVEI